MAPPILKFLRNGHLMLLTACAFLGGMAVSAKIACQTLPVGEVTFIRFLGGWLIFWPLVRSRAIDLRVVNRKLLYLRGALSSVAIVFFFYGISTIPVGHAVLLNNTYPLFVALLSLPILREKAGLDVFACFGVASIGIVIMLAPAALDDGVPLLGYLSTLVSALFAAGSILTTRVLRRTDGALAIFYYFTFVGMVITFPFLFLNPVVPGAGAALALVSMVLLSTVGQLLINQAFKYTQAGEGSVVLMASTAVAATLGALLLGDRYTREFFIGALLIFGAISWLTAKARIAARLDRGFSVQPGARAPVDKKGTAP